MIDHVYISVTDIDQARAFYLEALGPAGWREFGNYRASSGPDNAPDLFGLGDADYLSGAEGRLEYPVATAHVRRDRPLSGHRL